MRDILFRAIALVNDKHNGIKKGDMVFGHFVHNGVDAPCLLFGDGEQIEIDRNTLGQFTGLLDLAGTKIFEGDVTKRDYKCLGQHPRVARAHYSKVVFSKGAFGLKIMVDECVAPEDEETFTKSERVAYEHPTAPDYIHNDLSRETVIGNEHQQPELIAA